MSILFCCTLTECNIHAWPIITLLSYDSLSLSICNTVHCLKWYSLSEKNWTSLFMLASIRNIIKMEKMVIFLVYVIYIYIYKTVVHCNYVICNNTYVKLCAHQCNCWMTLFACIGIRWTFVICAIYTIEHRCQTSGGRVFFKSTSCATKTWWCSGNHYLLNLFYIAACNLFKRW